MRILFGLLLLLFSSVSAFAAENTDIAGLVAERAAIPAKSDALIAQMKENIAQKRVIEKEYAAVDADRERYRRDLAEATAFCSGRYEDAEYRRRKAICEQKKLELDERKAAIDGREAGIDRREKARLAAAAKLKAEYAALEKRGKQIEATISAAQPFGVIAERCRKEQKSAAAVSDCIDRRWAEAAGELRDYVNLETGRAFTQGEDWRAQIDAKSWPLQEKMETTVAVFLAEIGRYGDAAALMAAVKERKPGDPFLESAVDTLRGLGTRETNHAALMPAGRGIAEELKIAHLSRAAQADVMLGILLFREGNYQASLTKFADARKRYPKDEGLRDLSFLASQALAARDEPAPATRAAYLMQSSGALASSRLSLFLMQAGDTKKAELSLDETRERLGTVLKAAPDPTLGSIMRQVEDLGATVREQGTVNLVRPAGQRVYDTRSKADLMLDALSYGQKSWSASLRYIEIARAANPDNVQFQRAYDELAAIARQAGSGKSAK